MAYGGTMGRSSALYGGEAPILLVRAQGWLAQAGAIGGVQIVDADDLIRLLTKMPIRRLIERPRLQRGGNRIEKSSRLTSLEGRIPTKHAGTSGFLEPSPR